MATQKEQDKFVKGIQQVLKDQHAEKGPQGFFRLNTTAGYLFVAIGATAGEGVGVVHCRFEDAIMGRRIAHCNAVTGNWNHQYLGRMWTAEKAIEDFKEMLNAMRQRETTEPQ